MFLPIFILLPLQTRPKASLIYMALEAVCKLSKLLSCTLHHCPAREIHTLLFSILISFSVFICLRILRVRPGCLGYRKGFYCRFWFFLVTVLMPRNLEHVRPLHGWTARTLAAWDLLHSDLSFLGLPQISWDLSGVFLLNIGSLSLQTLLLHITLVIIA